MDSSETKQGDEVTKTFYEVEMPNETEKWIFPKSRIREVRVKIALKLNIFSALVTLHDPHTILPNEESDDDDYYYDEDAPILLKCTIEGIISEIQIPIMSVSIIDHMRFGDTNILPRLEELVTREHKSKLFAAVWFRAAAFGNDFVYTNYYAKEDDYFGCWHGYINMNNPGLHGQTALSIASARRHLDMVTCLIEAVADVNSVSESSNSALTLAALHGNHEIIEPLIRAQADCNHINDDKITSLIWAACHGHDEVIGELIKNAANVNYIGTRSYSAIMWAAEEGHVNIVTMLIDGFADMEIQDPNGDTAFTLACQLDNESVVDLLIRRGSNLHHENLDNDTGLMLAIRFGFDEVKNRILQLNVDVNALD